jgi:hypothetical protein
LEILELLGLSYNSLGKYPALLGQPLLLDYAKDCSNMHKVFLVVPLGVNRDTEVWHVGKLHLVKLRFFLGLDNINDRYVRDRRLVRQLPLLAFPILQPLGRLEGGTHVGVLPESGT